MAQSCLETRPVLGCYTNLAGVRQSILVHTVYQEGIPIAVAYTTADDAETPLNIDFAGGETVVAGDCPVAEPDVEWLELCDVDDTTGVVTKFYCRTITSFDATGAVVDPVQVDNFTNDKVTPYTPAGTVGKCSSCITRPTLGYINGWDFLKAPVQVDCVGGGACNVYMLSDPFFAGVDFESFTDTRNQILAYITANNCGSGSIFEAPAGIHVATDTGTLEWTANYLPPAPPLQPLGAYNFTGSLADVTAQLSDSSGNYLPPFSNGLYPEEVYGGNGFDTVLQSIVDDINNNTPAANMQYTLNIGDITVGGVLWTGSVLANGMPDLGTAPGYGGQVVRIEYTIDIEANLNALTDPSTAEIDIVTSAGEPATTFTVQATGVGQQWFIDTACYLHLVTRETQHLIP